MKDRKAVDVPRLHSDVRWALANGLGARDLVPMLERLHRYAPNGSDASIFAKTQLAELIVEKAPWRAARLARDVLAIADHARAWGLLGLAHTLLGNFRSARRAYVRALALEPGAVSYAHNLGHLLDSVFERPREALRWLALAYRAEPGEPEVAASYAHALVRAGRWEDAKRVLSCALAEPEASIEARLRRWANRRA